MSKTMSTAVSTINDLIDESSLAPEGEICVAYTTDGRTEAVSLELDMVLWGVKPGGTLYCDQIHSLYDENDQPIDPEVFLAKRMVDLISKLERVKTALLKKYPPQGPVGAHPCEVDDFGQEDVAAADAAASRVAGDILRAAGLVERRLSS